MAADRIVAEPSRSQRAVTAGVSTFLLFVDARMPTGGHAHSGGLEHAVAAGRIRDAEDLGPFLRGRLATAGLVDAALAAAAEPLGRLGPWSALDGEAAARCPGPALRRVARGQGRRLLRLGRSVWDAPHLESLAAVTGGAPMWPLAVGAVASAAGLDGRQAATAAALGAVTGPAWAAVRSLGLDPYVVAALLAELAPSVDETADRAFEAARDLPWAELPAANPPLLDLGTEDHARWEVRLFAS